MTGLGRSGIRLALGFYVVSVLVAAAVVSPPIFSAVPLLFMALFLYFRLRPPWPSINLSLDLYLLLALPLFYELTVGAELASLLSLPLLGLLDFDLQRVASYHHFADSRFRRRPTRLLASLALVIVISFTLGALLSKVSLIIVSALLAGYLLFLLTRILGAMPRTPVAVAKAVYRVVAGHNLSVTALLASKSKVAGWLYLTSPYQWVKLRPDRSALHRGKVDLSLKLTPPLAGRLTITLKGFALDRWGLMQHEFQVDVAELYVAPRARYAAWLARKYLETTRPGAVIPTVLTLSSFRQSAGSSRGVEYYGARPYHPGDSLRSIDWKHSAKLNELIVKEFDDPRASLAALLVNLTVDNVEEADRLIYAWITTSITLAREGIPTLLAAYKHDGVLETTDVLNPRQAVLKSLALSREIEVWARPQKYLQPPDLLRLRANIARLKMARPDSAAKFIELLELEFKSFSDNACSSPATRALSRVLGKGSARPTVLFISARNHDAEAVEMAKLTLMTRRFSFAEVSLDSPLRGLTMRPPAV